MAVELCKVSLWLEAVEPDKPLGFLDHHIVVGNGLLGATPRLLESGVPDAAFSALEGDHKPTVTARRKTNNYQRDRRNQQILELHLDPAALADPIAAEMAKIEALPENTASEVAAKASRYAELESAATTSRAKLAADAWCAAFVAMKTPEHTPITDDTVRCAGDNPDALTSEQRTEIARLTLRYRFLHWHLAFPQIYTVDLASASETGCVGGFDLILGNPPWDSLKPREEDFFSQHSPKFRSMSPEEQAAEMSSLLLLDEVEESWSTFRRNLFAQVHFLKSSGRYTLYSKGNLGKGDFNVYRNFVETALRNTRPRGYAAQIAPAGLYGGANASAIRHHLLDECELKLLIGCENTGQSFFPGVHPQTWFCIYAARTQGHTEAFSVAFGVSDPQQLPIPIDRLTRAPVDLIREQAPDTYAIPEQRNPFDVTITSKLVGAHPPFGTVVPGFPHRVTQRELDMTNDSALFTMDPAGLPVYEGRMLDQYDHRAKTYDSGHGKSAKWTARPFNDPMKAIAPQWRVLASQVPAKLGDRCSRYRIGYGDVANPRNERSFVAAIIPPETICGNKVPTLDFGQGEEWRYLPWLAVANSFTMDWLTRSRLSSPSLSLTVLDSLPFPRLAIDHPVTARLAPIVLRLSCTAPEMAGFWNSMVTYGWCEPVPVGTVPRHALTDLPSRSQARAEVDAVVAKHVYGLTGTELAHVLDQFPVLEKRDRKAHGTYATKNLVLEWYDRV